MGNAIAVELPHIEARPASENFRLSVAGSAVVKVKSAGNFHETQADLCLVASY